MNDPPSGSTHGVGMQPHTINTSVRNPARTPTSTPLPLESLPPLLPNDYYVGEGGEWIPYSRSCRRIGFVGRDEVVHEPVVLTLEQSINVAKDTCVRLVASGGPIAELARSQALNFNKLMSDLSSLHVQTQKRPATQPDQTEEPPSKRRFVASSVPSGLSSSETQASVLPIRLHNPVGLNRCYSNACVQLLLCFDNQFWTLLETAVGGNRFIGELLKIRDQEMNAQPNQRAIGDSWDLILAICEATAGDPKPKPYEDTSIQHDSSELFQKLIDLMPEQCSAMLRMTTHSVKTCHICDTKNENFDISIRTALLTQAAPTDTLQSLMPGDTSTEVREENCVQCNTDTQQTVVESLSVPIGTSYCLLEYYRHVHSDQPETGLEFRLCPDVILHGQCELSGAPVGWSPIGAVCKQGSQHSGHYWAQRLIGKQWLLVNDDDERLPISANLGQFSTDINLILCKRVARTESNSEQQHPTVNQPAVSQSTVNQPAVSQSTVTQPAVSQSTVNQPAVSQSTVTQPAVSQSTVNQPAVSQSTVNQPAVSQSTVNQPAVSQSTVNQPAVSQSTVNQPAVSQSTVNQPAVSQSTVTQPAVSQSTVNQPAVSQSTVNQPAVSQSTVNQPAVSQSTVTQPAVSQSTVNQPAVSQSTVTQPAVSQSTVNQPAVSQSTVNQPAVSQSTVNQPAVSQSTVTQPAVSQSPSPSVSARSLYKTPLPIQRPKTTVVPVPNTLTPSTIRPSGRPQSRLEAGSSRGSSSEIPIVSLHPLLKDHFFASSEWWVMGRTRDTRNGKHVLKCMSVSGFCAFVALESPGGKIATIVTGHGSGQSRQSQCKRAGVNSRARAYAFLLHAYDKYASEHNLPAIHAYSARIDQITVIPPIDPSDGELLKAIKSSVDNHRRKKTQEQ